MCKMLRCNFILSVHRLISPCWSLFISDHVTMTMLEKLWFHSGSGFADVCYVNTVFSNRLADCHCTHEGCSALASSLKSNPSHLRVLDLSGNDLGDCGVTELSGFLKETFCQLETLKWVSCSLTNTECEMRESNATHLFHILVFTVSWCFRQFSQLTSPLTSPISNTV